MSNKIKSHLKRQEFFPGWIGIFTNPAYQLRKIIAKKIGFYAPRLHGKLLDYGCGSKPYKELFINVQSYVGIDMENPGHDHKNEEIDVFYDGKTIPFANDEFDCVFSSQVLEHVSDIDQSISEINRVLKPAGLFLATIPFVFIEHEIPNDYRRLTVYGMEEILKKYNFEIVEIERLGTYTDVINQLKIMYFMNRKFFRKKLSRPIRKLIFGYYNLKSIIYNFLLPKDTTMYENIIVLAKKCAQ